VNDVKTKNIFDLMAGGARIPFGSKREETAGYTLDALAAEAAACLRCRLRETAGAIVFGEGNPEAELMFVGEGPGAEEDRLGRPFVGAAGQLLDKILEAAEISRGEVYITNVVKCRPPGNRLPVREEVEACLPHLRQQIALIRPRIIVCLGSLATQALVDPKAKITQVRGTWFERDGIHLMPTFHPAALLRDPSRKRPVWEDIKKVRDAYRKTG
jgi:DNA polymerase